MNSPRLKSSQWLPAMHDEVKAMCAAQSPLFMIWLHRGRFQWGSSLLSSLCCLFCPECPLLCLLLVMGRRFPFAGGFAASLQENDPDGPGERFCLGRFYSLHLFRNAHRFTEVLSDPPALLQLLEDREQLLLLLFLNFGIHSL